MKLSVMAFGLLLLATTTVNAQPVVVAASEMANTVAIPIGAWAEALREGVLSLILAALAYGFRALPANVVNLLRTFRAEQLLERAVDYALNSVVEAAKNKSIIQVDVGNAVAAKAVQYILDHGAKALIEWMGGATVIRQKVIARLPVAENVALK